VFVHAFNTGHLKLEFLKQICNAKLAHLRVNFQSLGELRYCGLGLLSIYLMRVLAELEHGFKLLLDIRDG
jgi:hypothetical protein